MTSDDQIYVIGSSNTDMVVKAARLPAAGDCFNGALAAVLSHGRSLGGEHSICQPGGRGLGHSSWGANFSALRR